jgi:hypothetical protein
VLTSDTAYAELDIEHRLTPPKSPQTHGKVDRSNGRTQQAPQSHYIGSDEQLETTLHSYVLLYNQQLPKSAITSKTPLRSMKDWHTLKKQLCRKRPYYLKGCDSGESDNDHR